MKKPLLVFTLLSIFKTASGVKQYWSFFPNPPWLHLVQLGERFPEPTVTGNMTTIVAGLDKKPIGNGTDPVIYNFTGLSATHPWCIDTGKNSNVLGHNCIRPTFMNYTNYMWYNESQERIMVLGMPSTPCRMSRPETQETCNGTIFSIPVPPCPLALHENTTLKFSAGCSARNPTRFTQAGYENYRSWHNDSHYPQYPTFPDYKTIPAQVGYTFHIENNTGATWKVLLSLGGVSTTIKGVQTNYTGRVCLGGAYAFMYSGAHTSATKGDSTQGQVTFTRSNSTGIYNITCLNCVVAECIGPKTTGLIFVVTRAKYVFTPVEAED